MCPRAAPSPPRRGASMDIRDQPQHPATGMPGCRPAAPSSPSVGPNSHLQPLRLADQLTLEYAANGTLLQRLAFRVKRRLFLRWLARNRNRLMLIDIDGRDLSERGRRAQTDISRELLSLRRWPKSGPAALRCK